MRPKDADIGLTIDFDRGVSNPINVFSAMTEMLSAFHRFDELLLNAVDPKLRPMMVLEEVEAESITSWIRNKIEKIDDQALKEFDIKQQVGVYAVKAKYRIIEYLDERHERNERERLNQLQKDLYVLARENEIGAFPLPGQIPLRQLIPPMDQFQAAKKLLGPHDRVLIKSLAREHPVNKDQNMLVSEILPDEGENISIGIMEMTLLVRKPDMLGNALWEFKHGRTSIFAHIQDEDWLNKFKAGQEIVIPGSSLKCSVRYEYEYDKAGALLKSRHDVVKVYHVIGPEEGLQMGLLDKEED